MERPITRLEGITELLRAMHYKVSDHVLSLSSGPATEEEATALQLPPGAEVIHLKRVRLQASVPLTYSTQTLPRSLFPGPIGDYDWSTPMHQLLESVGYTEAAANTHIRAATLPPGEAAASGIPRRCRVCSSCRRSCPAPGSSCSMRTTICGATTSPTTCGESGTDARPGGA